MNVQKGSHKKAQKAQKALRMPLVLFVLPGAELLTLIV
jgi:hypothetical protein